MPTFGTAAIREMFDDMYDIAMQLVLKWERSVCISRRPMYSVIIVHNAISFGPNVIVNPSEDFTRLTFDTIALCSMSYRRVPFHIDCRAMTL